MRIASVGGLLFTFLDKDKAGLRRMSPRLQCASSTITSLRAMSSATSRLQRVRRKLRLADSRITLPKSSPRSKHKGKGDYVGLHLLEPARIGGLYPGGRAGLCPQRGGCEHRRLGRHFLHLCKLGKRSDHLRGSSWRYAGCKPAPSEEAPYSSSYPQRRLSSAFHG